MVMQHHFFALDMSAAITRVSDSCHTCASLEKLPTSLASQSSEDPPEVVGASFAADIIRRNRQVILLLRECTTSYTASCPVPDEKSSTLCDALARLVVALHPLDGPQAVIWVDPRPCTGICVTENHICFTASWHLSRSWSHQKLQQKSCCRTSCAGTRRRAVTSGAWRRTCYWICYCHCPPELATPQPKPVLTGALDRAQPVHQRADTHQWLTAHCSQAPSSPNQPSFQQSGQRWLPPTSSRSPLQVGDLVYMKSDRDKSRACDH